MSPSSVVRRRTVEHAVDVIGRPDLLQVVDYMVHFLVGDEGAMHAHRQAGARREEQHVALAEQRFGAHLVEDGARIDLR